MKLFHFHKWSKWTEPLNTCDDLTVIQAKYCEICNTCQIREVKGSRYIGIKAPTLRKTQEK